MQQEQKITNKTISIFREKLIDGFRFYRLDDLDRSQAISIRETILFDFVRQYKPLGGIDYFYSEVIVKGMELESERVQDIRAEDGSTIWNNFSLP